MVLKTGFRLLQSITILLMSLVCVVLSQARLIPSVYSQTIEQNQIVVVNPSLSPNDRSQDMDTLLSTTQVQAELSTLPGWQFTGQAIYKAFTFADFVSAIAFVNQLVEPAEASGHHPDINISYNRVVITLTTHDAGGLTAKDIAMAHSIAQIHTN